MNGSPLLPSLVESQRSRDQILAPRDGDGYSSNTTFAQGGFNLFQDSLILGSLTLNS